MSSDDFVKGHKRGQAGVVKTGQLVEEWIEKGVLWCMLAYCGNMFLISSSLRVISCTGSRRFSKGMYSQSTYDGRKISVNTGRSAYGFACGRKIKDEITDLGSKQSLGWTRGR